MCSLKSAFFLTGLFIYFSTAVSAQEKAQVTVVEGPHSGKQDHHWEVVQNDLAAAKTKLDAQAAVLGVLISEKSTLSGDALLAKIEEIKTQHKKYEQMVVDYNKQNDDYLTKYPERGVKEKRIYRRVKMKTLESFEDDVSVRGRMNKLHNKVLRQYPRAKKQHSTTAAKYETGPSPANTQPSAEKKAPEVTDKINFKK